MPDLYGLISLGSWRPAHKTVGIAVEEYCFDGRASRVARPDEGSISVAGGVDPGADFAAGASQADHEAQGLCAYLTISRPCRERIGPAEAALSSRKSSHRYLWMSLEAMIFDVYFLAGCGMKKDL